MDGSATLQHEENEQVNLASLTPAAMAGLMTKATGRSVDIDQVQRDIEAGAPVSSDGTMNLLSYAAWLAMKAQEAGH